MLPFLIESIERFVLYVYLHVNTINSDDCDLEHGHVNQFNNPVPTSTDMLL